MKYNKKQIEQLTVLAGKFDVSMDEVKKEFTEIIDSKQLATRDKATRPKMAMRMLLAKLSAKLDRKSFGGKTEDIIIRVEMKEEPTSFKKNDGTVGYRSSVYCTVSADDEDFFSVLTLWNEANECNPNMVVGKTYATKAVRNGNQLSMNNPEELTSIEDKLPAMSDVITDSYQMVELADAELNISDDYNDLKLIKGVISGAWSKETRNGNMMGFLKIISEDGDDSMVAKFSRIYEQVNYWDDGSLVYVLGQVTPAVYNEDTGELQYDVSAWGNLIIPIDAFEKVVETEDDDDDDEEVDENSDSTIDEADDEDVADWDEDEDDWDE